tara:strand:+ start:301 stop:630 length:330 start_codon:yes stop_codon:yes gene_type:complete
MKIEERLRILISATKADKTVAETVESILDPLRRYDLTTGSNLEYTLLRYTALGSLSATSKDLFLHRNSVLYRLQRIEDLTGIPVRNQSVRNDLFVILSLVCSEYLRLEQ